MTNPCACLSASPDKGYWCDLPIYHDGDHQHYDHELRIMHTWMREDYDE